MDPAQVSAGDQALMEQRAHELHRVATRAEAELLDIPGERKPGRERRQAGHVLLRGQCQGKLPSAFRSGVAHPRFGEEAELPEQFATGQAELLERTGSDERFGLFARDARAHQEVAQRTVGPVRRALAEDLLGCGGIGRVAGVLADVLPAAATGDISRSLAFARS